MNKIEEINKQIAIIQKDIDKLTKLEVIAIKNNNNDELQLLSYVYLKLADIMNLLESIRPLLKTEREKLLIELGELALKEYEFIPDSFDAAKETEWNELQEKIDDLIKQIKEMR